MTASVVLIDTTLFIGKNYINGRWVPAISGKAFNVTGQLALRPLRLP